MAWLNGNIVGCINGVAVRRARLVLRWATIFGGHTTLLSLPSHQGQLSLLSSEGQEMSSGPKGGNTMQLGSTAGWIISHVWMAGKLCDPVKTRAILSTLEIS